MAQGIARHNFKEPASYLVTAVPVGSLTTWDATNKNGNITLSGGNLTASVNGMRGNVHYGQCLQRLVQSRRAEDLLGDGRRPIAARWCRWR